MFTSIFFRNPITELFICEGWMVLHMGFWDDKEPSESMVARYIRNGAPDWISNFVATGNANGTAMEEFLRYLYDCIENYSESGSDVRLYDTLAEVKTTSVWKDGSGKWQHIEPNHNWSVLLLVRIEYHSIDIYLMCREAFQMALDDGAATDQGKKGTSFEGYWFSPWDKALEYATLVESITENPDEGDGDCEAMQSALDECQ